MPLLLMGRLDEASALAAGQGIFPEGSFTERCFASPSNANCFCPVSRSQPANDRKPNA